MGCKKKVVVLTTEIKRFTRRYKAWMVLRHKTEPKLKARILHLKEFRQQIKRKLITGFEARSILEEKSLNPQLWTSMGIWTSKVFPSHLILMERVRRRL